jgi:hypothetical protein
MSSLPFNPATRSFEQFEDGKIYTVVYLDREMDVATGLFLCRNSAGFSVLEPWGGTRQPKGGVTILGMRKMEKE